jgi:hypothetical protein
VTLFLAGGAAVALTAILVVIVVVLVNGGDGEDGAATPASGSVGGTLNGPEPTLSTQAAALAPQIGDFNVRYRANDAYVVNAFAFANIGPFSSVKAGEALADQWGYREGYTVTLTPDGQLAGVLEGRFYVTAEVYLFNSLDGARQAYSTFEQFYAAAPASERQQTRGLANDSSAWKLIKDTVGTSDVVAVYHRFVFRRGNMVAVIQTFGGDPFMTIDRARDIAVVIDDKALEKRPAPLPTPARTGTPDATPQQTR